MLRREIEALRHWDERACVALNRALGSAVLFVPLRLVSWLGNGIFWYSLMLALLLQQGREAALPVLHMAFVGFVCTAAYTMVKRGTSRPRPYQRLSREVAAGARALDRFSFPSGHTLHAVAFTLVASAHYPRLGPLLLLFTLLTAVSRVALGLHYPSDVLAGAAIGGLIAAASFWI
ncbi:MAG TPA: phosphatase PAP2 family protein [Burkholderiales bacterium]|nr:phosphatase PAP2 family protein [Burkholderiales bacterium]